MAKARATGRVARDPARFKDRKEIPARGPLGDPPKWMKKSSQIEAWKTFADELPWLNYSHRAIVSIAAEIRGRQIAGEDVGVKAFSLLRMVLNSMGATPADASKVQMPDESEDADPADQYF